MGFPDTKERWLNGNPEGKWVRGVMNQDTWEQYLANLAKTGLKYKSAAMANVHYVTVSSYRDKHNLHDEEALAMQKYRERIEIEIDRRAIEGWEEPVFSQKLGTEIGRVRKYSDNLLMFLAKRHIPEYRETLKVDAKVSGGVLVVGATPETAEEWLNRAQETDPMPPGTDPYPPLEEAKKESPPLEGDEVQAWLSEAGG